MICVRICLGLKGITITRYDSNDRDSDTASDTASLANGEVGRKTKSVSAWNFLFDFCFFIFFSVGARCF